MTHQQQMALVDVNNLVLGQSVRVLDHLATLPGINGQLLAVARANLETGWMYAARAIVLHKGTAA